MKITKNRDNLLRKSDCKAHGKVFLSLVVLTFIFFIPLISSFEFDNVLSYSENDMKVDFNDCDFWIGTCFNDGKYFGSAELKSHSSVEEVLQFGYGMWGTSMYYDFTDWEFYKDGLGEVIFRDEITEKEVEKEYYFVEWKEVEVDKLDYKSDCVWSEEEKLNECESIEIGSHKEMEFQWVRLNNKDISGVNKRIGIEVYFEKDEYLDAVWTIAGKKVTKLRKLVYS